MKVLIYVRPNSKEFLINLAREMDSSCEIKTLCDFRGYGDVWAGEFLKKGARETCDLQCDVIRNIRLRCRFLRRISENTAEKLIRKYYYGVSELFDEYEPDMVLAQMPDNYCMDIIQRVAVSRGIVIINMLELFIDGYSRITLRGERNVIREVDNEEAERVISKLLDKSYTANYAKDLGTSYYQHLYHIVRRKLVENLYYPLKKIISQDYWNYHYNTLIYKGVAVRDVVNMGVDKLFQHIDSVDINEDAVYVPLHCYPESTVDYYGDDPEFALYEDLMVRFVREADPKVQFLIKEHPAMYGARNTRFYKELLSFPNVVLLHPYDDSNYVLEKVRFILVFSGSVGVEALLREKVLFSITSNYYSDLNPNVHMVSRVSKELLSTEYIPYDNISFMKDVLAGAIPAKHGAQSELMKSDIKTMAHYMKKYFDSKPIQRLN